MELEMTDAIELKPIETGFLVKEINWNQANKYYGFETLQKALDHIKRLLGDKEKNEVLLQNL